MDKVLQSSAQRRTFLKNMTHLIGKIIDQKYRLLRLLGQGGMGSVYEAEHILLHTKVAIKVIKEEYAAVPEAFQRFLREAQAAGAIGHPNITKVHDFGEDAGLVYAVMELLRGKSLATLLEERGRLAPEPAVAIILQVLSALHAAHKAGIIHRDLKPDNVFICIDSRSREEVKLLDFGVAKFNRPENVGLGLTKTGAILGTPHYLAPEQARGKKDIDERIDIWSTGVMLYEVLSGRLPYDGNNYNAVMGAILLKTPEPLEGIAPHVPAGLAAVVHKALSKDREQRYGSVAEMIDALMPFAGDDSEEGDSIVIPMRSTGSPITPLPSRPPLCELPTESISAAAAGETDPGEPSPRESAPQAMRPSGSVPTSTPVGPQIPTVTTMEAIGSNSFAAPIKRPRNKTALKWSLAGVAAGIALISISLLVVYRPATSVSLPNDRPTSSFEENVAVDDSPGDGKKAAASPAQVSLTVEGTPAGARFFLDGAPITPPHLASPSDTPMRLKVESDGYNTVERTVVLDRDIVIHLPMNLHDAPPPKNNSSIRKSRQRGAPGRKAAREQRAHQQWADNPFD